jgi:hypothetical protein
MSDPSDIGGGLIGGGVLGALLTFFGIKSRMDKQDDRIDKMEERVRFIDTCEVIHKSIDSNLNEIKGDVKTIINNQKWDGRDRRRQ